MVGGLLGLSGGLLGGSWGALGGILGPSWPQDGPKSQEELEKLFLGPLLGRQNRPKINPKSIQDVIVFLMGCWIDFLFIF